MKVFGYGFPGWFEDCVPVVAIEISRKGNFIHDKCILHFIIILMVKWILQDYLRKLSFFGKYPT